ncbi:MAG TPA: hypothetical protein VGI41_09550 [Candidatus Udaeobacter sp.]|jgi:hypothetical protein
MTRTRRSVDRAHESELYTLLLGPSDDHHEADDLDIAGQSNDCNQSIPSMRAEQSSDEDYTKNCGEQ